MRCDKEKSRFSDVVYVFRMVNGFAGMLTLSSITRTACKLTDMAIPVTIAIVVELAMAGVGYTILVGLAVAGALILISVLLSYLDTYVSHDVSFRIVKLLQDRVYDHMDRIAPSGLAEKNAADSATVILSDINVFEWFVAHCLVEWIGTFAALVVCLVLLSGISAIAAVSVFVWLVLMMTIPFFSTEQAKQKGFIMKRLYGELNSVVADGVSGHKDIIAFHWTKAFYGRLHKVSDAYSQAQAKFASRGEWEKTWEAVAACLAVLTGLLLALEALPHSERTHLIPVFALCASAVGCVQGSLGESTNFGFVFGAAARIVSILEMKAHVCDTGTLTAENLQPEKEPWTISFQHVAFRYSDGLPLLKDISFTVRAPEIVAIVAASGGGKTTAARLLQRYWDVEAGIICINGTDIRQLTLDALRETVMLLPQDTYLFHGSIRQNLRLAKPDATENEMEAALALAQALSFTKRLENGLDYDLGENGGRLSGGERQRIALAQAFLKNPPILVLDEATSALDTRHERLVNEAIRKTRQGKITLVVAHRLSSMQSADRIVFIQDGSVMNSGSYLDLIQSCEAFQNLVKGECFEDNKE